jgi:flavin-dependent dehydrogenase
LVEKEEFPRPKLCGEFISPECWDHFARLGVADRMRTSSGTAVSDTVFYSRKGHSVSVPSEWFSHSGNGLGLSRAEMDSQLLERARECGVTVFQKAAVSGVTVDGGMIRGLTVRNESGTAHLSGQLIVDATGRARALARRVESNEPKGRRQNKAALVAFKTHLRKAGGGANVCEIYFYPGGYGGLNPIEGELSNLCFIVRAEEARIRESDPDRIVREVVSQNPRAAHTLREATVQSPWLAVSLNSFGPQPLVPAPGMIAVGDAAAFIDPFTGSGILMALQSGELLANTILDCVGDGSVQFAWLARSYQTRFARMFGSRLRTSALLRRAAFAPRLTEAAIFVSGNRWVRQMLTRATRTERTARQRLVTTKI